MSSTASEACARRGSAGGGICDPYRYGFWHVVNQLDSRRGASVTLPVGQLQGRCRYRRVQLARGLVATNAVITTNVPIAVPRARISHVPPIRSIVRPPALRAMIATQSTSMHTPAQPLVCQRRYFIINDLYQGIYVHDPVLHRAAGREYLVTNSPERPRCVPSAYRTGILAAMRLPSCWTALREQPVATSTAASIRCVAAPAVHPAGDGCWRLPRCPIEP